MTPRQMGRKGGKTTGASKVRGDSDYYRALAAKRETKSKRFPCGCVMSLDGPAVTCDEHSGEDEPGK